MTGHGNAFSGAQTIAEAWFNTGKDVYKGQSATGIYTNTLFFKAVGWDTTLSDRLQSYTIPDPSVDLIQDVNDQVYP
jgi:hypothetical protein